MLSPENYDRNSPIVQAIERGYEKWQEANCHETGCGCVTVYIYRELAEILEAQPALTNVISNTWSNGCAPNNVSTFTVECGR